MTLLLNPGPATGGQAVRSVTKSGEEVQIVAIDTAELPGGAMPMSAEELPLPTGAATQVTLAALNVIAAAIQTAVDAINGKTTAVNTGAIAGTVALDAPTLAALESITASTGGLTNTELRTDPVPMSVASLPLPTGAATQATLATIAGAVRAEDSAHTSGDAGMAMLAIRSDSDAPTANDGDYTILKLDEEGRLKVSSKPASYPDITGDITAVQASIGVPVAGGTVGGDVSRASNVMAFCTGTFAGVNVTFEGSLEATGDTNWFGLQAVRSNANTIETATGVLGAAPAYAWEMSVNALSRVRVRCTARTSGTQSWRFVQGTYATEPIPAAQVSGTQPVSGTVTANIGTGSLAAGTNLVGDVGMQVRANATGAMSTHHIVSAATTNVAQIKATAGRVFGWCLSNTTASWRYVKLHNVASATAGAAVTLTIGIPPNDKAQCTWPVGIAFATAISRSVVTGPADADATATAANDVVGDIYFA